MNLQEIFRDSEDLVEYQAGDVIMEEGEEGNLMFVVMSGEVSISLKGQEIAAVGPGEIIGEMALINSDLRSATVTATTDCQLAPIDQTSFESLLRHVPDFSMHVMNVLATRLQRAYEMIQH